MKVAIRTVGKHNAALLPLLFKSDIEIAFFADGDREKWQSSSDIPVIPVGEAYQLYDAGQIDKFFLSPYLHIAKELLSEMQEAGIADKDICIPSVNRIAEGRPFDVQETNSGDLSPNKWRQIYYLEFHISDSCNLNCSGCIHFSSLVEPGKLVPLAQVKHDLKRLRRIVEHIEVIRILGGEPFLNPNWREYVEAVREFYPYAEVHIATNGLLVKKLNQTDGDFLQSQKVTLDISVYKPLWGHEKDLVAKLIALGVEFGISAPITGFRSCLQKEPTIDAKFNRVQCGAYCFNLHYGRMAPCPIMMYIKDFNKYFGYNFPQEAPINLDEDMDFDAFMAKMNKPMDLCAFCNQNKKFRWSKFTGEGEVDWLADM